MNFEFSHGLITVDPPFGESSDSLGLLSLQADRRRRVPGCRPGPGVSRCLGGVWVVFWWCLGGRWFPGGVLVVSW